MTKDQSKLDVIEIPESVVRSHADIERLRDRLRRELWPVAIRRESAGRFRIAPLDEPKREGE